MSKKEELMNSERTENIKSEKEKLVEREKVETVDFKNVKLTKLEKVDTVKSEEIEDFVRLKLESTETFEHFHKKENHLDNPGNKETRKNPILQKVY